MSPRAYPLVGHLPLLRDVLTAAAQLRSLGDVVKLRLPPHDVFVLHHPRDIEQWLVHEHAAFRKDWSTKALEQVLGQGPVLGELSGARKVRRAIQGELSTRRVEALVPRIQACIDGMLSHLLDAASRVQASNPSLPSASQQAGSQASAVQPSAAQPSAQPSEPPALASSPVPAAAAPVDPASAALDPLPANGPLADDEAERPTTLFPGPCPPSEASTVASPPQPAGEPETPSTPPPGVVEAPAMESPATPEPEARSQAAAVAAGTQMSVAAAPCGEADTAASAEPKAVAEQVACAEQVASAEQVACAEQVAVPELAAAAAAEAPGARPVPAPLAASGSAPAAATSAAAGSERPSEPGAPESSRADDLASAVRAKLGAPADTSGAEASQEPSTPGGAPWDLFELMLRLSLDLAVSTLLGPDTDAVAPALQPLLEDFLRQQLGGGAGLKLPEWLPTRGNRRARANHTRLQQVLTQAVAKRRAAGEALALQPDLLGRLLRSKDEAGALLSDAQVTEEALAHVLLGHEPVALLLTFAIVLVAQHPEVERRMLAELDEHASYPGESALTAVERLPYLDAVLRETLRLYPAAFAVAREAVADAKIGECTIPRGAQVWAFQWSVQRDPRFFHLPERFRPERWIHGETRDLPRFAYFPLTGGLRASPGAHLVMTQVKLALARLLPRLSFRMVVPGLPALVAGSALKPKDGVPVYVALR